MTVRVAGCVGFRKSEMKIAATIKCQDWKDAAIRRARRAGVSCYHAPSRAAISRSCNVDDIVTPIRNVRGVDVAVILINNQITFQIHDIGLPERSDRNWCTECFTTIGRLNEEQAN